MDGVSGRKKKKTIQVKNTEFFFFFKENTAYPPRLEEIKKYWGFTGWVKPISSNMSVDFIFYHSRTT